MLLRDPKPGKSRRPRARMKPVRTKPRGLAAPHLQQTIPPAGAGVP